MSSAHRVARRRNNPLVVESAARASMDVLEPRTLLSVAATASLPAVTLTAGQTSSGVTLTSYFDDPTIPSGDTAVLLTTDLGSPDNAIPLYLTNAATPKTVANFLAYVSSGEYAETVIHRSVPGFIIQGGGYTTDGTHIATNGTVVGESATATLKNTTGTIAMALTGSPMNPAPNSGTSEWFFNLADNTNLDNASDGGPFTAFGQVVYNGLTTLDDIANLPIINDTGQGDGAWGSIPVKENTLVKGAEADSIDPDFLVTITPTVVPGGLTFAATSSNPSIVTPTLTNGTLSLAAATDEGGTATITVTATDMGGGTSTSTFDVTVNTPTPTLTLAGAAAQTATAGTGTSFALGSLTETFGTSPYTVTVDWGDGSTNTTFTTTEPGTIADHSHTFALPGTDTVTVTVTDASGAASNTATFPVTVAAAAPTPTATTTGLTPTIAATSVPPSPVAGIAAKGTVTVSLANATAGTSKGTTFVYVYADTPAEESNPTSGTQLGTAKRSAKLRANQSGSVTVPIRTTGLEAGTYQLVVVTTDADANLIALAPVATPLTVAAPVVSLSASITAVAASVVAGKQAAFTLTVTNAGDVTSTGPATIVVTLVQADGTSVQLPTVKSSAPLKVGKPAVYHLHLKVPATVAAGAVTPQAVFTQGTQPSTHSATAIATTTLSVT